MTALFLTIRKAAWKSWWQTVLWVGYNALGSLMPIWGTFFWIKLHGQSFHMNDFVKHGEFALYAATFLAPALQAVVRNVRDAKYLLGTGAVLLASFGLLVSVALYSGVVGAKSPNEIDQTFLFRTSIGLFVVSLGFAVIVTLLENEQTNLNIRGAEAAVQTALDQQVSKKAPENAGEIRDLPLAEEPEVVPEQELAARFKPPVSAADSHEKGERTNG